MLAPKAVLISKLCDFLPFLSTLLKLWDPLHHQWFCHLSSVTLKSAVYFIICSRVGVPASKRSWQRLRIADNSEGSKMKNLKELKTRCDTINHGIMLLLLRRNLYSLHRELELGEITSCKNEMRHSSTPVTLTWIQKWGKWRDNNDQFGTFCWHITVIAKISNCKPLKLC